MTKVLYFPPAYVSRVPVLLDLTDTAAVALVASGAGAYPVPMPLDRLPLVAAPTPTPTQTGIIGGVAINTLATSGPEAGMKLVWGDEFDGPLDLMGPAPAQRFGRWCPTRGNYLIFDPGQQPRASTGLGGVDADPYWTGHLDSNRGEPIASLSDIIVQSGGKLSLRQREMAAGEDKHVPFANQNTMSSMAHGAFDVMVTAPFVYKWEEQRFANYRDHMTTWFMNYMGFTRGDVEVDYEAASKKSGAGDGRQLEFNINAWDAVTRSETDSAGSDPVTVDWSTPKTMAFHADAQGVVNFYLEGQLGYQYAKRPEKVLAQPYHPVFSNHMYNVPRPTGLSRLEYGYIALYVPNKHYVPQVAPLLIQVASGESKTVVLPTQMALWGEPVTEKIEACMVEPNEPGGTTDGKFYLDLPPGVTFNSSTRELAINLTTPGRLNVGMYVIRAGCSCKVFRIAIEVGPVINIPSMITIELGKPFKLDLYPLVNCGVLVTGNDGRRAKQVTVAGLPSDLPYSGTTYLIDGTPGAVDTRTLTITGTNNGGQVATKEFTLRVTAPAAAGKYAFESWPALVANFDMSRDASYAVASGDFTALGNAVSGAGDLAKAPTVTSSPSRVPNALNGKSVARFNKNGVDGAGTTVLESAQNAPGAVVPAAAVLTGSNTAFTKAWLVRFDVGSGTCIIGGLSEQVSPTSTRNMTIVKRDPATADSSFRYGANTSSTSDLNLGRITEGVWHLITVRHNGDGTSDAWVDDTRVATAVPHSSASPWTGNARYSIGNCQGTTNQASRYPSTGLAGEMAHDVFSAAAQSDAEIAQMRADMKTEWKYNV
ncbi:hypothetical protein [Sphingomonas sp. Leaf62]|uniref:hypothetical protein n=1 Tax=Sphingomonas sp. Leaf62 TaxID=1736228 RepID=UPI0006F27CA3|nr:hypothetical protein [Sphingomonas sp. Leaf62]KQN78537.1 hypothetical protein ASE91_14045 [Sphingomonas sp. Leaf62]